MSARAATRTNGINGALKHAVNAAEARPSSPDTLREKSVAADSTESDSETANTSPIDEKLALAADLLTTLTTSATADARAKAAAEISNLVETDGVATLSKYKILVGLATGLHNTKQPVAREGAIAGLEALLKSSILRQVEPFVIALLPVLLERLADKVRVVLFACWSWLYPFADSDQFFCISCHFCDCRLTGQNRPSRGELCVEGSLRGFGAVCDQAGPPHAPGWH